MSIDSIDLRLLQVLNAVLAEGSVVRAARRLHVTPSAISNALARLRDLLDDPLVTRKGRGIVPTPRAAELAPVIARALRELDTAVHGARFDPATCARRFTLAVADPGQLAFAPPLARRMARELPRAQLRVVGIESLISLGDLASSEIDAHVGVRHDGPGLRHEPLFDEPTVLVARRRHPAIRRRIECQHVHVEMLPGRGLRDAVGDAYRRANVRRVIAMTVPTFTAAVAVVAATDLVATVPASFASTIGARLGVVVLRGATPRHVVSLGLSWHERTHADPASIAFRALVKSAVLEARSS